MLSIGSVQTLSDQHLTLINLLRSQLKTSLLYQGLEAMVGTLDDTLETQTETEKSKAATAEEEEEESSSVTAARRSLLASSPLMAALRPPLQQGLTSQSSLQCTTASPSSSSSSSTSAREVGCCALLGEAPALLLSLLLYVAPPSLWHDFSPEVQEMLSKLTGDSALEQMPELRHEVQALKFQLRQMASNYET